MACEGEGASGLMKSAVGLGPRPRLCPRRSTLLSLSEHDSLSTATVHPVNRDPATRDRPSRLISDFRQPSSHQGADPPGSSLSAPLQPCTAS